MKDKANMTALTQEVLDIEELENRLELAAQTAECGCCGSNGNNCDCNTKVVAKGVGTGAISTC